MAQIVAITRIEHGKGDGEVEVYEIGEEISDLPEGIRKSLVLNGSAVEIGKDRKYTMDVPMAPADEETRLRDELIAKSQGVTVENTDKSPVAPTPKVGPTKPAENAPRPATTQPKP